MKRLKENPLWIYVVVLIGMISYLLFTPVSLEASEFSQSDVPTKDYFDMTLLYWAIGVVGGCIALTLIYVSYRKYKGEQRRKKQENSYDE